MKKLMLVAYLFFGGFKLLCIDLFEFDKYPFISPRDRYYNFMKMLGRCEFLELEELIPKVFDANCVKIVNNRTICNNLHEINLHLKSEKQKIKNWEIVIAHPGDNLHLYNKMGAVMYLKFTFTNGLYVMKNQFVMTLIKWNEQGLINKINEISVLLFS